MLRWKFGCDQVRAFGKSVDESLLDASLRGAMRPGSLEEIKRIDPWLIEKVVIDIESF